MPDSPHSRRAILLLACGAVIGLTVAGYGLFTAKGTRSHSVPPEDLALVNERPILRSDFMTQVQTQFGVPYARSTAQQRARVLGDMVAEELLVQRGVEIDLPSFDPNVRTAMVDGVELEASANVLAQRPTEAQLRAYFQRHADRYASEGVLRMRELVLRADATTTIDQAMQAATLAVTALRSGSPLDQVLHRYRLIDSGRLIQGGQIDTGEIPEFAVKAKLGAELYAVALDLHGGQTSDPVRQSDGAHVVVMVEHRPSQPQDYGAVADRVWSDYRADAMQQVREANLRYLRSRADIRLSDDAQALQNTQR
jgi:hypothetical protein